ncbi:MAG: DUF2914 domain-containing protein, partial [Gammaproteobacteria bacterium]|nr:DUF2914 domain-containing protein [Gammaproteobacteria bacterium]
FLNDDPDSPRNPPAAQLTMDKSIGSAADNGSSPFRDTSTASDAGSIQLPQAQSIEDAGQPEVSQTAATAPVSPALPDVRAATPVDPDPVPDDRQAIGEELRRLVTAESNDPLAKIAVRRSASPTVAAPTESVATQPAPKQAAPKQAAPTQAAPTQAALAQQASTQAAPTQSVPTQVAPPVTAVAPPAETAAPVFNEGEVPNGLLVDSRVARGRLTSAVEQREPVDDLGSTIMGSGAAEQQYYFFTELRELAGQRVRHRWIYNDRVVAEVPFNVGEAWRWRVYSSKTFLPSMTGRWHVQVVLEDNSIIYSLPFTFIQ